MGMEKEYSEDNWTWHRYDHLDEIDFNDAGDYKEALQAWAKNTSENKTNVMEIDTSVRNKEILSGSLIYQQTTKEQHENSLFHYFLTRDFLLTVDFDSNVIQSDESLLLKKMDYTNNAIDGFFVILGEILSDNIKKIDKFEVRLNDLLWKIKDKNNINRLEEIYELRHQILVWKNIMIPVKEIRLGVEETFGEGVTEGTEFKRTCKRIERGYTLVREFQQEIDDLVNFEEMVSMHRGNEIVKTLTVITTLMTPIATWGALWGMNFKVMPELEWKYGYLFSIIIIIATTVALYIMLVKKGWMGDILRGKKKNSFFK
ncbi:Mg2+ transporter protein, CorA-like protein [Cytobacillus firmus]|nr:Mg2+ transporter protein, CorA-like protein [Cytobacillus firmus]MBG9552592.1 Mg2+ transporter protein, CorA-like protein [Cytobacillus firmus]MBG9556907.1 Mg2+ transporter protein, CorA-like protein [Cytobacillus firmus]MBG9574131.1 Mg2+ transporter protein, CorA-like protein [Cytobacillus firmus]